MKASKLIVLAGGILGVIAFFLPLVTVDHRGTKVSASAFQVVKGIGEIQAAADTDEAKARIAAMDGEGKKAVSDVDTELSKIKGFVVAIFLPALLLVVIPGPLIRRYEDNPRLKGFVKGATAAAAGAIAGAAIVVADSIIEDAWSIVIAVAALALMLQPWRKVTEPQLVGLAAIVGLIAFG